MPSDLGDFLRTRRSRVRPEDAGLQAFSGRRRVPGLRRDEVAHLASVSTSYYTSLEQGRTAQVSAEVLAGIARALCLDGFEIAHLQNLVAATRVRPTPVTRPEPAPDDPPEPGLTDLLSSLGDVPAMVLDRALDVIAWNPFGALLFGPSYAVDAVADPAGRPNLARIMFLDRETRDFFVDWELAANGTVQHLRLMVGRHPDEPALTELVGELSARSEAFTRLWAAHGVRPASRATFDLRHPLVGPLTVTRHPLYLSGDEGKIVTVATAEPGSPSAEALARLGALAAERHPS